MSFGDQKEGRVEEEEEEYDGDGDHRGERGMKRWVGGVEVVIGCWL